ncbi:hypothetical protein GOFOIKOB_5607 [Methylobacterium tardum]|uniref:Uncharacterized protein n=1 Tax=Methylobacterium tardum TaxID=374432 RepID=A0AA37WPD0_9HYPH|nr:hypothetical protein [Methylobacterium tardum]URD34615.1 hypothetical protein M6G65_18640 [Methylobacterium tardum]GJE52534.1 hypothetical protein GOFOIKOB_5607 [Methylobacterium tardum]GLS68064.1 hypothetical protein GCM10007890_00750 [Methylobacterium tardum]
MATLSLALKPLLSRPRSPQPLLDQGLGRQPGPVTIALAAMRSADPDLDRQRLRELRRRIADRIEADIALLDALDGDTDLEDENEHGGDIQDEPHDPEEDMGAEEDEGVVGLVAFDGTNYRRVRS